MRIAVAQDKEKWWQVRELEISGPAEGDIAKYDPEKRVYLKVADAVSHKQGWGEAKQDKPVLGEKLRIANEEFEHGIGTHSASELIYNLKGKGFQRFFAKCGPQGTNSKQVMTFEVHLDGEMAFDSGDMSAGDTAKYVDLNVADSRELKLVVTPGSDGETAYDHANWVDACFVKK